MLGILRFFLAGCVVLFHFNGGVFNIGILAVNFFYVISGYLITLILNETYKFKAKEFLFNRILRLYPTYYVLAAIAFVLVSTTAGAVKFHPSWNGVFQSGDVLGNVLVFPWAVLYDPPGADTMPPLLSIASDAARYRLIPSTWSIAMEIVCYFLLWLFLARRPAYACIGLLLGIAWQFWMFHSYTEPALHYGPLGAAILPFSCGSLSYFAAKKTDLRRAETMVTNRVQFGLLGAVVAAFLVNWGLSAKFDPSIFYGPFYYLNTLLGCIAVVTLHGLRVRGSLNRVTTWLGDLSYPVFLGQYIGGYVAWHILGTSAPVRGPAIFLIGYPITILFAVGCVLFVDRPIKALRSKIRADASTKAIARKTA